MFIGKNMFWAQKILTTVKNEQHRLFFLLKDRHLLMLKPDVTRKWWI